MKTGLYILFLLSPLFLLGNNVQVSNVSLVDQDVDLNKIFIQFDLSWENSWRVSGGPANWDASWVFLKYRASGGDWNHLYMSYVDGTNDGHIVPAEATIQTVPAGIGCFIHKSTDGTGHNNFQNIKLKWDYGGTGLDDNALIEVKVFAVEMVYIPGGAFYIGGGSGGTEANRFYITPFGNSYQISSENQIPVSAAFGSLYYQNQAGSNGGDQQGPIPAAYPKGYEAFYIMKYEVSQGQFVAFFNTLKETQKLAHDISDPTHKNSDGVVARNGFSYTSGNATTPHPDIPLNYQNWANATAYLDWAGLRPVSEFEYEKACRGPLLPAADEFAWGNKEIPAPSSPYVLVNSGTAHELVSNPEAEAAGVTYLVTASGLGGPMRCGIHAASAISKNRIESGGSFYGVMELTGNLYERLVSVGTPDGRGFTGAHGNGVLSPLGFHNVANWPAGNTGGVGYRGGSYANGADYLRVGDRFDAANQSDIVNSRIGFRGARTQ